MLHPHHANSPEVLRRFHREGEQMLELRHPHIVGADEPGRSRGAISSPWSTCPAAVWPTVERRRLLDLARAAAIVTQVAAALDNVHPAIIHRDLKPRNILFIRDGVAQITDFGIARVRDQVTITGAGQMLGTPQYMAPEQAKPLLAPISPATDVWALGVILYEMLCGENFVAEKPSAVLYQVVHETPDTTDPAEPQSAPRGGTDPDQSSGQRRPAALRAGGQMASEGRRLPQRPGRSRRHPSGPPPTPPHHADPSSRRTEGSCCWAEWLARPHCLPALAVRA